MIKSNFRKSCARKNRPDKKSVRVCVLSVLIKFATTSANHLPTRSSLRRIVQELLPIGMFYVPTALQPATMVVQAGFQSTSTESASQQTTTAGLVLFSRPATTGGDEPNSIRYRGSPTMMICKWGFHGARKRQPCVWRVWGNKRVEFQPWQPGPAERP